MSIKNQITEEMITAAKLLLYSMSITEVIRPVVTEYKTKILKEMSVYTDVKWQEKKLIASPDKAYLMNDADAKIYYRRCDEERNKKFAERRPGYCPLLIAESEERQAKRLFIDSLEPITQINYKKIACTPNCSANIQKLKELGLKLIVTYCNDEGIDLKAL